MHPKLKKYKKRFKAFRMACLDFFNACLFLVRPGRGKLVNKYEYRVVGMMRTGNHAIITWLFSQLPEPKCFLNYVDEAKNPFIYFKRKGTLTQFSQTYFDDTCLKCEQLGLFRSKEAIIYSFEDAFIDDVFSVKFIANSRRWVGRSEKVYNILLIRDPYNLFASRLKREEKHKNRYSLRIPAERAKLSAMWKQYALEALGETSLIPSPRIVINYNRWASSSDYRRLIAADLGVVNFSDDAINMVSGIGGGSSFSGESKRPPTRRELLSRWRSYADDPVFIEIFRDAEINRLAERLFDEIPGIQEWLDEIA